jgi:hypothetical protein
MRTPLVRGLMSGMLFYFGLSAIFSLRAGILRHARMDLLVIEGCYLVCLPLALWLLSDSKMAFKISFVLLAFSAAVLFFAPILELFTTLRSGVPPLSSLRLGVTCAFPCVVAIASRRFAKTREI